MKNEFEQEVIDSTLGPKKRVRLEKTHEHYVNNAELLVEMTAYSNAYREWKASDFTTDKPVMSERLGSMVMKIANRTVYNPKYIRFPSIREEMVSDAIENIIAYSHNFKPDAPTRSGRPNPFSYITTICMNAYKQRIVAEKHEFMIKAKYVQSGQIQDQLDEVMGDAENSNSAGIRANIEMYYNVQLPTKDKLDLSTPEKVDKMLDEHAETEPEAEPEGLECFF